MRSFDTMHPAAAAVQLLLTVGIAMFCTEPLLLTVSLLCAAGYDLLRRGRQTLRFYAAVLGAAGVLALLNPLWNQHGTTVLLVINNRAVTAEALIYGAVSGLRLAAVLCWFRIFSGLMTSEKLFYLLRFLSPKLAMVFSMSMRNLTLYRQQLRSIQASQRALGLYREGHLIDDIRGGLRVFSVLLTWALENGIITANSMQARGYGIGRRSSFVYFQMRMPDLILLLTAVLLSAVSAAGLLSGSLTWQFYPVCVLPAYDGHGRLSLAAYTLLALLPLIYEGKERLTWHILRRV